MNRRLEIDNPRVRQHPVCPLCHDFKASGLVVCWDCYREHGLRSGNLEAERKIDDFERRLSEVNS